MVVIAITGTPRTGKTSAAKELRSLLAASKRRFRLIDLNKTAVRMGFVCGLDRKRGVKVVDMKKLGAYIARQRGNIILESHYAHFFGADMIFVLTTSPRVLEKRMRRAGWSEAKIHENLEAERVNLILGESCGMHRKVYGIDTTRAGPKAVAKKILSILRREFPENA